MYMESNSEVFQGRPFCAQTAKTFYIGMGLFFYALFVIYDTFFLKDGDKNEARVSVVI
jgi:hypothetical protein